MLDGKNILITGGTGSFGHKFVQMTLENYSPNKIVILSRDEMKQWEMQKIYADNEKVRFFIGDVRDLRRLQRAFKGIDVVIHAAASKIVPTAEYNPFECIKTNIYGAMNVVDAALDAGVEKVVALSTDKASSPINIYGASKLTSDKIFVNSNVYAGKSDSRFSVVRYGNVMGSRGSIIPFFNEIKHKGEFPITDFRMTRFMITLEQGVKLVWQSLAEMMGGEIFIKKCPSMKVTDIAKAIAPDNKLIEIGIRPGEKLHEQMIGKEDASFCYEYSEFFKIIPQIPINRVCLDEQIGNGKLVDDEFTYSSDTNVDWMLPDQLKQWMQEVGYLG